MSVKALIAATSLTLLTSSYLPPPQVPQQLCLKTCQVSNELVNVIAQFEGYSPFVYKDAVGNPTIGYGHLITKGETAFKQPLLPPDADKLLRRDLSPKVDAVNKLVNRPLYPSQFNALVSFTYNVGEGSLKKSTLLKKVNTQQDLEVPPQFLKWSSADGKVLSGLQMRRRLEAQMYKSGTEQVTEIVHN